MANNEQSLVLLPKLKRILKLTGENIRLARLRRQISSQMMANRAGITLSTLRKIEEGSSEISLSVFLNVLLCLGLEGDIEKIASDDMLGRKLQDIEMLKQRKSDF